MTAAFREERLAPFGIVRVYEQGTPWDSLDASELDALVVEHKVVVLRGVATWKSKAEMIDAARRLGSIQAWQFGGVHDLKVDSSADNYLYTTHKVPLHWDGAFASENPRMLVFRCLTDCGDSGGETLFVDTTRALDAATPEQRTQWRGKVRLTTKKKAYYGGTVERDMIVPHPASGADTLRFAEPVDDRNPVAVEIVSSENSEAEVKSLSDFLANPDFCYRHSWQGGDVVLADNHALLHGREAFPATVKRRIWRANILNRKRPWWQALADSWRIRRPEFIRAEIPIAMIPAALFAASWESLVSWAFAEVFLLFWLLFQIGDVVNCYADRHADRVFKTHLSEAIRRLGRRNVVTQLIVMTAMIAGLSLHLWSALGRPFWIPLGALVGGVMAALYSVGPKPMKHSGVFQIGWYNAILFVGPMVLVSGAFLEWPSLYLLAVSATFGLVQTAVLLVNNAEDLREDRDESIHTASVVLGSKRTLTVALGCAVAGSVAVLVLLWTPSLIGALFFVSTTATTCWLWNLRGKAKELDGDELDRLLRKAGKWVPRFLTSNAWTALLMAIATRM